MERNKLRAAIALRGMSIGDLCRSAGIAYTTFYRKMRDPEPGERPPEFTQGEISGIAAALSLSRDEIVDIFFGTMVS